eukprot:4151988-Pleurochrysis_carterae.AAC.1
MQVIIAHPLRDAQVSTATSGRHTNTHTRVWAPETTALHTTATARMTACVRAQTAFKHAPRGKRHVGKSSQAL